MRNQDWEAAIEAARIALGIGVEPEPEPLVLPDPLPSASFIAVNIDRNTVRQRAMDNKARVQIERLFEVHIPEDEPIPDHLALKLKLHWNKWGGLSPIVYI